MQELRRGGRRDRARRRRRCWRPGARGAGSGRRRPSACPECGGRRSPHAAIRRLSGWMMANSSSPMRASRSGLSTRRSEPLGNAAQEIVALAPRRALSLTMRKRSMSTRWMASCRPPLACASSLTRERLEELFAAGDVRQRVHGRPRPARSFFVFRRRRTQQKDRRRRRSGDEPCRQRRSRRERRSRRRTSAWIRGLLAEAGDR